MSEGNFVRLAVYDSESDAILAKAILEDNKIHATVSGLEPSALGIALDGDDAIEVFILADDLERAQALIENLADTNEEGDPIPAWTCQCGEDVDEGFFVCWSCGAEYKATP
jgi:hypothetical protein